MVEEDALGLDRAAVDGERGAGDERGVVGAQPHNRVGDVLGRPERATRLGTEQRGPSARVAVQKRSLDSSPGLAGGAPAGSGSHTGAADARSGAARFCATKSAKALSRAAVSPFFFCSASLRAVTAASRSAISLSSAASDP